MRDVAVSLRLPSQQRAGFFHCKPSMQWLSGAVGLTHHHGGFAGSQAQGHARSCRAPGSKSDGRAAGRRKAAEAARLALFRHVRFNRVLVAITYKGKYFSLTDAKARCCRCPSSAHVAIAAPIRFS